MSISFLGRARNAVGRRYDRLRRAVPKQYHNRFVANRGPVDLAIFEDAFPKLSYDYKVNEINGYLEAIPNSMVFSCESLFDVHIKEYAKTYPSLASRVRYWHPGGREPLNASPRLAYCQFQCNAYRYLRFMEQNQIPFIFTLYPAPEFRLNNEESDRQLQRICGSPMFRKVIVTQTVSRDYLIDRGFCHPTQVEFIFGAALRTDFYGDETVPHKYYKRDKDVLDVCFVAHRYKSCPTGSDKGYDVFVDVAHRLARSPVPVRFHVIGDYGPDILDVSDIRELITFYGQRRPEFLRPFYSNMDIIISANDKSIAIEGAFDGFPTGCCTEASLAGVAVFCTDPLGLNVEFVDGEDLVLIPRDAERIAEVVQQYSREPERLHTLATNGRRASQRVYSYERQMGPRMRLLAEHMGHVV